MKGLLVKAYGQVERGIMNAVTHKNKVSPVRVAVLLVIVHGILHLSLALSMFGALLGLLCFAAEKFGDEPAAATA